MRMRKTFPANDPQSWQDWLKKNYASETEVWLVFPKIRTGRKGMSYEEAVEEALCYGWIDSIIQRIDHETYARKFTPRTDHLKWSAVNKRRVVKLIRENRMTAFGLAKIGYSSPEQSPPRAKPKEFVVPKVLEIALRKNPQASDNFNHLAPSYRRLYATWICSAKREETRQKRLEEAIRLLAKGEKLGLK